jgi:hypothetical protein
MVNTANSSMLGGETIGGGSSGGGAGMAPGAISGLVNSIIGGVTSVVGAYQYADRLKKNLEFQSVVSAFNSRMSALNLELSEKTAQQFMRAGEQAQSQISMKAAKVKGAQKASQGARGVQIGVGSAAEEIATTDLMKETDRNTINANTVREAWNQRLAGVLGQTTTVNYATQSAMLNASAESISPWAAAGTTLMKSATNVAAQWYKYKYKEKSELADLFSSYSGGSF